MKVQATLKNLRISPRKTRLVTRGLVGSSVNEALVQLSKQTKKASSPLSDLLKSAIANAVHNNGLAQENLVVHEVQVGDGMRLKRWLPRAFGRATPMIRRGSNVTIVLTERVVAESVAKKAEAVKEKQETKANNRKKGGQKFHLLRIWMFFLKWPTNLF